MRELAWALAIFNLSLAVGAIHAALSMRGQLLTCQAFLEALQ